MRVTTDGIVIRQNKISNNRRIIVLFTKEYGKISAGTTINERGKGKSALALRPFTYVEYELFKNRGYYNINSASVKKSFYSIGEDLNRFEIASVALNYLDKVLEEEQAKPRMFELTLDFFETIAEAKSNYETILYAYIIKNFAMQGILPEIKRCVDCGKKYADFDKKPAFSVSGGGIICKECTIKYTSTPNSLIFNPEFDIVEVIDFFIKRPLSVFTKVSLKPEISEQIKHIIAEYLEFHLGVSLLDNDFRL